MFVRREGYSPSAACEVGTDAILISASCTYLCV